MLQHVPDAASQEEIFAELLRVLRPGGLLVGSEGYDTEDTRRAHVEDLFVPIDPVGLPRWLRAVGFTGVTIQRGEYDFRFHARKPGSPR